MLLYHGTDLASARNLLAGEPLDALRAASRKIDGLPGFFLATTSVDAEFFAVRRRQKPGAVIEYDLTDRAVAELTTAGAVLRPIPHGQDSPGFSGGEMYVPIDAFHVFNELLNRGEIRVSAAP